MNTERLAELLKVAGPAAALVLSMGGVGVGIAMQWGAVEQQLKDLSAQVAVLAQDLVSRSDAAARDRGEIDFRLRAIEGEQQRSRREHAR